jgi:hypothetical protein
VSDSITLSVDLDDLTIDEIDAVESITDVALDELSAVGRKKAKLLRALAVIAKHREDPEAFPITTPAEIAEASRKVGRLKLSLSDSPEDGSGNDHEQPA